ncbi:MAG: hypothetical protein HN704_05690 [Bacteroidetes bacterium]|nr:hypothetical protein [Bacteroidota bacterium]
MNFKYSLDKSSKKFICPACNKKTFVKYIDNETNEFLTKAGRCDREQKCSFHQKPENNNIQINDSIEKPKPISFIENEILKKSLAKYENNNFVLYLNNLFNADIANQLIKKYQIGTSKYWNGANVFWQIDKKGNVRTGKIMLYDTHNGKRKKKPFNHIGWVHKAKKQPNFNLKQCLFGEHLLTDNNKPIAIVESEKTAIICSVYLPKYFWLATGGKSNFNYEKLKVLSKRLVYFFPDVACYEDWNTKINELSKFISARFIVDNKLENAAETYDKGFDIADFLIKYDYREFLNETIIEQKPASFEIINETTLENKPKIKPEPDLWNVSELKDYFNSIELPTTPIRLYECGIISDIKLFVSSSLATIERNKNNKTYLPYYERLKQLKEIICNEKQT